MQIVFIDLDWLWFGLTIEFNYTKTTKNENKKSKKSTARRAEIEGMNASGQSRVAQIFDPADSTRLLDRALEKRTDQGEVVKTGEAGRYIMFIYSGRPSGWLPMGYEEFVPFARWKCGYRRNEARMCSQPLARTASNFSRPLKKLDGSTTSKKEGAEEG